VLGGVERLRLDTRVWTDRGRSSRTTTIAGARGRDHPHRVIPPRGPDRSRVLAVATTRSKRARCRRGRAPRARLPPPTQDHFRLAEQHGRCRGLVVLSTMCSSESSSRNDHGRHAPSGLAHLVEGAVHHACIAGSNSMRRILPLRPGRPFFEHARRDLRQSRREPVDAGEGGERVVDRRERARMAISTSWSMANTGSCVKVRCGR